MSKNNEEQYSKFGTIKSLKSDVLNLDGNIFRFLDSMKVLLLTFLRTKSM
jgi:hypothetical protein